MLNRLHHISKQENVSISSEAMQTIVNLSAGDLRKAVTTLQSVQQLYGQNGTQISEGNLVEASGRIPKDVVSALWTAIRANKHSQLEAAVDDFICNGYPVGALLLTLLDDVLEDATFEDIQKAHICSRIAAADKALIDGASEDLQLHDTLCAISRAIQTPDV
jgi:replication factor C subunit 2/4